MLLNEKQRCVTASLLEKKSLRERKNKDTAAATGREFHLLYCVCFYCLETVRSFFFVPFLMDEVLVLVFKPVMYRGGTLRTSRSSFFR
jgi:hypothetical protein